MARELGIILTICVIIFTLYWFPYAPTEASHSLGTGFFISNTGYVVTNEHVVRNSDNKMVLVLYKGQWRNAYVIEKNYRKDLAILQLLDNINTPCLKISQTRYSTPIDAQVIRYEDPLKSLTPIVNNIHITHRYLNFAWWFNSTFIFEKLIIPGNSGSPLVKNNEYIGVAEARSPWASYAVSDVELRDFITNYKNMCYSQTNDLSSVVVKIYV